MLNHINVRVHKIWEQISNLLENYFLLREINYDLFMVCLRLIKSMVNHMKRTNNMISEFKIQGLP
jgi:hypothetical protein